MKYQNINDYEILYLIEEQDENAYYYLYNKYKPLITKMATNYYRKYKNIGIEYDDLFQEGMYGLSEAINRFNNMENNLFYTFANICIKREMERLIIKSLRNKNYILTSAYSLDAQISEEGLQIIDILYDENEIIEKQLVDKEKCEYLNKLKYYLKDHYSQVYELKINGFSNKDIATLLDVKYKDVDNALRGIKNQLKKIVKNDIEY